MQRAISALFLLVFAAFSQTRGRLVDYALLLEDAPVAQTGQGSLALQSAPAQARLQRIHQAQRSVLAELQRRQVHVQASSQVLVNAIFVSAVAGDRGGTSRRSRCGSRGSCAALAP